MKGMINYTIDCLVNPDSTDQILMVLLDSINIDKFVKDVEELDTI